MPPRSKITQLPDEVRKALEQRLIASQFSDYDGLAEWLGEQGFEIHRSSIYRFGAKFEDRVRAIKVSTDQARAIVEATPDDDGAMNEALLRLTQQTAFDILVDFKIDPDTVDFPKLVRAISDMNRSSVTLKKYQVEARSRAKTAAEKTEQLLQGKAGITPEILQRVRTEIYGIAP